ncbi:hypothetical protein BS78_06G284800 [Paspalum vaginatum]|nr:hypothetical protein BS78_06G284800 [Paspalum vaginatum]
MHLLQTRKSMVEQAEPQGTEQAETLAAESPVAPAQSCCDLARDEWIWRRELRGFRRARGTRGCSGGRRTGSRRREKTPAFRSHRAGSGRFSLGRWDSAGRWTERPILSLSASEDFCDVDKHTARLVEFIILALNMLDLHSCVFI